VNPNAMDEDLDRIVERCLTSAQRDAAGERDAETDAAFAALFAVVDPPRPAPGFARAVAERARRERLFEGRRAAGARWIGSTGSVAAVAAALVAVYASLIALQPAVVTETLAAMVTIVIRAALAVLEFLTPAIDVWGVAANVGRAFLTALATPEASLAVSVALVAGALVFATLQRMLFSGEEPSTW
jgi:hypothetical protein